MTQQPPPPVAAPDLPSPLHGPDPTPPPRSGLSTRAIILIVIVVAALPLVIAVVAGFVGTVAIIVPQMQMKQKRFACTNNLSQIAGLFLMDASRTPPKRSGPAVLLEWRKRGTRIKVGQESILLCPDDPAAVSRDTPEWRARWDDVDLDDPAPGLCSYAVRDFVNFPLVEDSPELQAIAACLHHRGGAIVAFEDGSTRLVEFAELGIADASEMTVGPDSAAELLRPLTFGPSQRK